MSQPEQYAVGLSVVVVIGFALLSTALCSGATFARSGPVVIVVAIVFGSLHLRSRLDRWKQVVRCVADETKATLLNEVGATPERIEAAVDQAVAQAKRELIPMVEAAKKRLIRTEASLLIAGTMIWGFGDLLFFACPGCQG